MSGERGKLARIDWTNFAGLNTKSSSEAIAMRPDRGPQLRVAENTDHFSTYAAVSKPPGSSRVLAAAYTEGSVAQDVSWLGFYKASDLNGQILRHVLAAAGTKLHKVTGTTLTALTGVGFPITETRTAALVHSGDRFQDLFLIQNQDPDLVGRGDTPVKYDGVQIQRWGVEAPGTVETVREAFASAASFTVTNGTATNESTTTIDGAAVSVTKTSVIAVNMDLEKTYAAFTIDSFVAGTPKALVRLFIPRSQLVKLAQTDAVQIFLGSDGTLTTAFWRFDFDRGDLIEGWNNLYIDLTAADSTTGAPVNTAINIARFRLNTLTAATVFSSLVWDRFVSLDRGVPTLAEGAVGTVFAFDGGVRTYKVSYLTKYGHEALSLTTPILTTKGWKTVAEVQVNDYVYSPSGTPTRVTKVTEVFNNRPCYKVKFRTGAEIIADAGHEWEVFYRPQMINKTPLIRTTEAMVSEANKYNIKINQPIEMPHRELLIEPYVLGAWLGDGTSAGSQFTTNDPEILDEIRLYGYDVVKQPSTKYSYCIRTLSPKLRNLNLIKNKHIPEDYIFNSKENRLALLQGLMDTDGHSGSTGKCVFSNKNKNLIDGVCFILSSLGIRYSVKESFKGEFNIWNVTFRASKALPVFRLKRKFDRQLDKIREHVGYHRIKSITPVASVPVKCISVEDSSHLFLAGRELITTHNSNASPISNSITLTAARASIELSNLPVSTDEQVIARRIYRTVADGAIHLFVDQIYDNVTTTFSDTVPDLGLSSTSAPEAGDLNDDNSPPPKAGIVKVWKRTVFLAGLPDRPETVVFSEDDEPESFPTLNEVTLNSKITAIYETYSGLVIDTELGKWQVAGDNPDFKFDPLIRNIGCVGRRAAGETRISGYSVDREGMRLYDLNNPLKISEVIRDKFDSSFNKQNIELIHTLSSKDRNAIIMFVPDANGDYKDNNYVYQYAQDVVEQGWWWQLVLPTTINPLCTVELEDTDGDFHIYMGGDDGMIYELFDAAATSWALVNGSTEAIVSRLTTPYERPGNLQLADPEGNTGRFMPRLMELRVTGDATTWTALVETANAGDQPTASASATITFTFATNERRLVLPVPMTRAGDYCRITLTNSQAGVSSTILGFSVWGHIGPGQAPLLTGML